MFWHCCTQVWDPKPLIRKGRDRHLFLFELHLIFAKEVKDSQVSNNVSANRKKINKIKKKLVPVLVSILTVNESLTFLGQIQICV